MSQVITNAFEQYWQSSLAAEQPVVLDEFILADIPNLDITSPIDPATGLPPESQIVHRQNVDQRGRINNNAVAYTIVMDTTVGDFSFNAMYLRNKQNGVIGMIVYKGRETKLKTDQTTGQTGNSLVKSMLMGYDQAAEATLTNVDAGTWQIDYAARLRGMDEDIRQLQADLYGHHTFVGDGFKVVEKDGAYQVTQGVAIVGGLRVELKAPEVIHPGTKPIGVWVDAHRAGSLLSEHQNHFTIITSVADLADHVDGNGYQHYVAKLATIQADGTIMDSRMRGGLEGQFDLLLGEVKDRYKKSSGDVEAWREDFEDDTECIKAALLSGGIVFKLSKDVYNIRGGEIFVPGFVTLDLSGKTVRLLDNAGSSRKNLIELSGRGSLVNGFVDGNYINNIGDVGDWATLDSVPFCHGVYTSRLQTNDDVFRPSFNSFVDRVEVFDTIRSCFVLVGIDQSHGFLKAKNSFADHLLYFSNCDNVSYESAIIEGFCRAEAISVGTSGSGVSSYAKADKFRGGKTVLRNIRKSDYFVSGYDEEPVWIQGRDVGGGVSGGFDSVYVDDSEIADKLRGNGRRISFIGGYTVSIGLLDIKSVVVSSSIVGNAYPLDVRQGANVSVGKYKINLSALDEGYDFPVSPVRCDGGSQCSIGSIEAKILARGATNLRWYYCEDSQINIGSMDYEADGGTVFVLQAAAMDSSIVVDKVVSAVGFESVERIIRIGSRIFEGRIVLSNPKSVKSASLGDSRDINAFNVGELELYSESTGIYTVGNIFGGLVGQRLRLIGDGKAQRGEGDIKWYGGSDNLFRTIQYGEVVDLYLATNGYWYEVTRKDYASTVRYGKGAPIGQIIPMWRWQEYFDEDAEKWYKAKGTASNMDWVALN